MASRECDATDTLTALLRVADTPLVLAQQLGAWVGSAPTLEEELALANIALDLLGQATLVLERAADIEGAGRDADALAFLRDAGDFRNLLLAERPNGDFAHTIFRQLMYECWAAELWQALTASSDEMLAGIAGKAVLETRYHLEHVGGWFVRLADGTDESRRRMDAAIEALWPYVREPFADTDEVDEVVAAAGIVPLAAQLEPAWLARVTEWFAAAGLQAPKHGHVHTGGRFGRHTEGLGHILAELQFLQRAYPGAVW
jgi:ring-1,2-phenylacetyl-CoA epoxidase subunit PaaC